MDGGNEKVIDLILNQLNKVEDKLDDNTKLTLSLSLKMDNMPEHFDLMIKQHELDYHKNDHAVLAWKWIYEQKAKIALAAMLGVALCVVPIAEIEKYLDIVKVFIIG